MEGKRAVGVEVEEVLGRVLTLAAERVADAVALLIDVGEADGVGDTGESDFLALTVDDLRGGGVCKMM